MNTTLPITLLILAIGFSIAGRYIWPSSWMVYVGIISFIAYELVIAYQSPYKFATGLSCLIALGAASNLLCLAVNGGQMPVYAKNIEVFGMHKLAGPDTRLGFLADWIAIPGLGYFSPGDMVLILPAIAALAWLTWRSVMRVTRRLREENSEA